MAGSTPVPIEGVPVLFSLSGNGYSSARIVHLTGEHFNIIMYYKMLILKEIINIIIIIIIGLCLFNTTFFFIRNTFIHSVVNKVRTSSAHSCTIWLGHSSSHALKSSTFAAC